jgi:hypothetical protein
MARAKQDMWKHVPPPSAQRAEPRRRDGFLRILFPLSIKHQISYIKHILMDPFSYLSVLISIAWWIFYRWRNQQPWTFFLFIFVLISPTILYLASIILFPPESALDEFVDYKTHYYSNHRAFFALFGLFTPVDFLDSLLKGIPHFLELGPTVFHQQHALFRWPSDGRDHTQRTLPSMVCHHLSGADSCD